MSTIFVMIPSLSDDRIKDTILDCIDKSDNPIGLSFGISLQGLSSIDLSDIKNEIRVITLPSNIVYGLGRTRSFIQGLYNDEDYVLSIDCHTGFKKGWDSDLISWHSQLPESSMAVISQPLRDRFLDIFYKTIVTETEHLGSHIPIEHSSKCFIDSKDREIYDPFLSNWIMPHFIFAGKEIMKLKYPIGYLWGEEDILLSLLLFCNGFSIYEIPKTYMVTEAKDKKSIFDRSSFLNSPLKYNDFELSDVDSGAIGEYLGIEYPKVNTRWSNHLINIGATEDDLPNSKKQLALLILKGYNYYMDLRGLKKSIQDFFDFHGVSEIQLRNRLKDRVL